MLVFTAAQVSRFWNNFFGNFVGRGKGESNPSPKYIKYVYSLHKQKYAYVMDYNTPPSASHIFFHNTNIPSSTIFNEYRV